MKVHSALRLALVGITLFLTSRFAQPATASDVLWHPELLDSQGVGCKFNSSADGGADAFVITNGDTVSFIFTRLGETFRDGRRPNVSVSPCRLVLPLEVMQGQRVDEINQTLTYGIVKSEGVQARLDFISNFARRQPNGKSRPSDLNENMASTTVVFPANQIFNEPLAILSQPVSRTREDQRPDSPNKRFCNKERPRLLNYHSDILVRVNKMREDATISFAVDGLDLKYEMGLKIRTCRNQ